jgi:hypothetical protein
MGTRLLLDEERIIYYKGQKKYPHPEGYNPF